MTARARLLNADGGMSLLRAGLGGGRPPGVEALMSSNGRALRWSSQEKVVGRAELACSHQSPDARKASDYAERSIKGAPLGWQGGLPWGRFAKLKEHRVVVTAVLDVVGLV